MPIRLLRTPMSHRINVPRRKAIREADAARDAREPAHAAVLYGAVIKRWGPTFGLLMQLGNALKDSGAFERAEHVYKTALQERPHDADCHLQLGHLMKLAGNLEQAEFYYAEANRLDVEMTHAEAELRAVEEKRSRLLLEDVIGTETAGVAKVPGCSSRTALMRQRLDDHFMLRRN